MKTCKWCGKAFEVDYTFRKYCCKECAKAADKIVRLEYKNKNEDKIKKRQREYYKKHHKRKISYCKMCGVELPHGKQEYCLNCLLKDYKHSAGKAHTTAYSRLSNRGYDKEMIEYEIEQRGYDL